VIGQTASLQVLLAIEHALPGGQVDTRAGETLGLRGHLAAPARGKNESCVDNNKPIYYYQNEK
jgi:hypothetical protein